LTPCTRIVPSSLPPHSRIRSTSTEQPGAFAPPMMQPTTSMSLARALSISDGSKRSKGVSNTFFINSAMILIIVLSYIFAREMPVITKFYNQQHSVGNERRNILIMLGLTGNVIIPNSAVSPSEETFETHYLAFRA